MNIGIVMAGGSGKRMWPLSRENKPKQLLRLFLEKTFLEKSVERVSLCADKVVISCGKDISNEIKKMLPNNDLIVEPQRMDTAGAIALCAFNFQDEDMLIFCPSDSYIDSDVAFKNTIESAVKIAQEKKCVVLVGVKPTYPATGFGYLETENSGKVKRFCEKPKKEIAQDYVKKGFYWNSGVFVCNCKVMKDLFRENASDIFNIISEIKNKGKIDELYYKLRKTSFDFAVMEKAKEIFFVPAQYYWNDIGSFAAIIEVVKEKNVVLNGKFIEENSKGNIVHTEDKKTVALIDCEDLVVIDTNDALLVCPKKSCEKIKNLVDEKVSSELK
jgi:mannose-1-phosphate guanylyltransferase